MRMTLTTMALRYQMVNDLKDIQAGVSEFQHILPSSQSTTLLSRHISGGSQPASYPVSNRSASESPAVLLSRYPDSQKIYTRNDKVDTRSAPMNERARSHLAA